MPMRVQLHGAVPEPRPHTLSGQAVDDHQLARVLLDPKARPAVALDIGEVEVVARLDLAKAIPRRARVVEHVEEVDVMTRRLAR